MAELRHGKLSITVPDDWSDRSQIVLVAPPASGLTAAKSARPAPRYATNVVVTFVPNDSGVTSARDYAEQMHRALVAEGVRFKDAGGAAMALGSDQAWRSARELEVDGLIVHQESVVLVRASIIVVATATMEGSAARTGGAVLEQVLASLRLG